MEEFGKLLRKYRLKAGYKTLKMFGDALAEDGLSYEDSILCRWQKGYREPKDRQVYLIILCIFIKQGVIYRLDQANQFLHSAGRGNLSAEEIERLPRTLTSFAPFQAPRRVSNYVHRLGIKQLKKDVIDGKTVLLYGPAGVGKTCTAIELAHDLKNKFEDGVIWCRLDTSSPLDILNSIARSFGENVAEIRDINTRASAVSSILADKEVLIVLDNAETDDRLVSLISSSKKSATIITSREKVVSFVDRAIDLAPFSFGESMELFSKLISEEFVIRHKPVLMKISKMIGNLPIALRIISKQLEYYQDDPGKLIQLLKIEMIKLSKYKYDNKSLQSSLQAGFSSLSEELKKTLVESAVFCGPDFSPDGVAYLLDCRVEVADGLLKELVSHSFLEFSVTGRFRFHPIIKQFVEGMLDDTVVWKTAAQFHGKLLSGIGRANSSKYEQIEKELDNILGEWKECFEQGYFDVLLNLWEFFGIFLWDSGRWTLVEELGCQVVEAAGKSNNDAAAAMCLVRELCWLYYWWGDMEEAERCLNNVEFFNDDIKHLFLIRKGKIHQAKGNYNLSLTILHRLEEKLKKINSLSLLADTYTYIGESYWALDLNEVARQMFFVAIDLCNKVKDYPQKAIVLTRLGGLSLVSGQTDLAKTYFDESIKIETEIRRKVGGDIWNNLGLLLVQKKLNNNKTISNSYIKIATKSLKKLKMKSGVKKASVFLQKISPLLEENNCHIFPSHSL